MTSLIEKLVSIIAPHHCEVCGMQDNILCEPCIFSEQISAPAMCGICSELKQDWILCNNCQDATGISRMWIGGDYSDTLQKVISAYKFERKKAAHEPLSSIMLNVLPFYNWIVVPIPTAPKRIRVRGYDQTKLLAEDIAKARNLRVLPALLHASGKRQVGANRIQRFKQSTKMFSMRSNVSVRGVNILLVDDVCTTGATLNAAAKTLLKAGAAHIDAVVVSKRL